MNDGLKWYHLNHLDWNTGKPHKCWSFKKGEQYDYTNAKLIPPPLVREDDGWALATVKPEGEPIQYIEMEWEGAEYLGTWWSIKFRTRWFHIYYRHRSWTKDIFYIAKD